MFVTGPQERKIKQPEPDVTYDVLIIGGGPAGLTATLYSARKGLLTLLLTKDLGGQALYTSVIENYMGFKNISGKELVEKFFNQISQFPIALELYEEVVSLKKERNNFLLKTVGGKIFFAKSVIIATGRSPKPLGIPGEKELVGRGVSYCATCDAPLFKKLDTAVIGGGNSAIAAALELAKICNKVYLVVRSKVRADAVLVERMGQFDNVVKLFKHHPKKIFGQERVESILLFDEEKKREYEIPLSGVFIEAGLKPNTEFVKGFLELNERDEIAINCNCETSLPGVFACGDCTSVQEKQIIIACGEGAKASLQAYHYLLKQI